MLSLKINMHNRQFYYISLLILFLIASISSGTYETWIPKSDNRTYLRCPVDKCTFDPTETSWTKDECCICNSEPSWRLSGNTQLLFLEYGRRDGSASVMGNTSEIARLIHNNGFLSSLPKNMCEFINVVEIDLQNNQITAIGNISCLKSLDTLDLSYNLVSSIENSTFVGLTSLRIFRASHNGLISLEPFSLTGINMAIFLVDLSYNNLTKIDISNIVPENQVCRYDFSANQITNMVNEGGFTLNPNKIYECGFMDLDKNDFDKFIDFTDLGISDVHILGKVMKCGFSMLDMKWVCDCQMEPFLELAEKIISRIWRDYFNITCWNPPEYRGLSVSDYFINNGHLDLLICNVSSAEKCPKTCSCYYQPKNRRTVVNCTNAGLTEIPEYMPDKENLTIILTNNNIQSFEKRDYYNRTLVLDLSNNSINSVSDEAIANLKHNIVLNLDGNDLTVLPREFQTLDPCTNQLGKVIIPCKCEDLWIRDWIINKRGEQCRNITEIYCQTTKGVISSLDLTKEDVCESDNNVMTVLYICFSVTLTIVIGISSVFYTFRYELYLLNRKLSPRKPNQIHSVPLFDVFFSFSEENFEVRQWVVHKLDKLLQSARYKSFISCRDSLPGSIKEEELVENIERSKNYIIILSDDYLIGDSHWTRTEWKYIWYSFRQNPERKIIVINFDQLETCDITDDRLKAFLRLGLDVDFSDRKHRMLRDIQRKLGMPVCHGYGLRNAKTKYIARTDNIYIHI